MYTTPLLVAFQEYLSTADNFDDLEVVSHYNLLATASTEQKNALTPIAQHHSDSVLALWKAPGGDEQPVVWLDSEGSAGVLANSLEQFLSISPYGVATLYDIMRCCSPDKTIAERKRLIALKFPAGEISVRLREQQEDFAGSVPYQQWLLEVCGISIAPNPISIIEQANNNYPTFESWFKEFI